MAKGLMIALGLGKPGPMRKGKAEPEVDVETEDMTDEETSTPDQLEAAKALIDAVKAKDAEGVVMAYKALKYCCEDMESEEEEAPSSSRGSNPPGKMGKY